MGLTTRTLADRATTMLDSVALPHRPRLTDTGVTFLDSLGDQLIPHVGRRKRLRAC